MRIALVLALACAAFASAPSSLKQNAAPFVLFGAMPLIGHATPVIFEAAALARRNVTSRIVVATTGFDGGPHGDLNSMFNALDGEAYGLGIEYVQVGHINADKHNLVNFDVAVDSKVRGCDSVRCDMRKACRLMR